MWTFTFWILTAIVHWVVGQVDSTVPSCAISCWENTRYISKCMDDSTCLCSEAEYQNSVFQCLYSQCDSAHFGSALHHTISQCSEIGGQILPAMPPIPKHDALRRREAEYLAGAKLYGSGSAMGLPTQSSSFLTQSANYQTQSANYLTQSAALPYSTNAPTSPPTYFPLQTATAPANIPASQTEPAYTALAASERVNPLLYTGVAPGPRHSIALYTFATLGALYLAL